MGWFINLTVTLLGILVGGELLSYPVPVDFIGKLQRWNVNRSSPPITYAIKGATQDILDYSGAVYDSFTLWQNAPGSYLTFEEAPDPNNALITINFTRQSVGENSSGYADVKTSSDGFMLSCKIELLVGDAAIFQSFAKTALHEIGHCIGLGHSLIPQAIMSYEPQQSDFALDTDDIAAIARLYPESGAKPAEPLGCGLASGQGQKHFGFVGLLLWPAALVLALSRRKKPVPPCAIKSSIT